MKKASAKEQPSAEAQPELTREEIDKIPGAIAARGQLVTPFTNEMIAIIKKLKVPWDKLGETQQGMLISSIASRSTDFANQVIDLLASAEHPSFEVKLDEALTIKEHVLAGKISADAKTDFLLAMTQAAGRVVRITIIDAKIKEDGSATRVEADPEAPALPLDRKPEPQAGPPGDHDLVDAADESRLEVAD